jgi:hypothetical protein
MHYREVTIPRPAALTFTTLASALEQQKFEIDTRDESARVFIADRTTGRAWPLWLLAAVTLGLVGQPDSVRVTARVDEAEEDSSLRPSRRNNFTAGRRPIRRLSPIF